MGTVIYLMMDSEKETQRADLELPTEEEKSNIESDHDAEKTDLNVENVESKEETNKETQDSVAVESDEILLENKDDEKGVSNVECVNVQEQSGGEEAEESQSCDDVLKCASVDSHPDIEESMQVDTFEQIEQADTSKAHFTEGDSVVESSACIISKELDGISDVESQDPLEQQGKKSDNIDSESDGGVVESGISTKVNSLDSNEAEKEKTDDQPSDSANVDSPEPMDVSITNKEVESESEDLPTAEKCNTTESDERGDKSPVISDSGEKESTSGKSAHEEVNTEFVQIISQEKQDDSQIENNSIMDAEDPFGGDDNLITENSEQSETDAISKNKENFEKVDSQTENLEDVISVKPVEIETICEKEKSPVKSDDAAAAVAASTDVSEDMTRETPVDECEKAEENKPKSTAESKSVDSVEEKSETDEKDKEKEIEVEKEKEKPSSTNVESVPSVLPGQDDELCIIPDSMKDVEESGKDADVNEADKSEEAEKTSEESAQAAQATDAREKTLVNKDTDAEIVINELPTVQTITNVSQSITDVIDLEEEPEKASEVEEIQSTETCKQCNQVKVCKIKVKVGTDLFSVCSKACKSAFKSANNKAMDIPSDGVNSKREKRCASCLLIIEATDERCLSWETMEFCNEECLGKFQTKYGSYCRNCNGSVQPVSLGKYCVRFGYDVRQFCCSVCLEEFKKGLKVCTYCQKDISAGTEGFLAPVGDKGQFKDFCTQDCMEKYSRMSSTEPPIIEKKACSVCQEVCIQYSLIFFLSNLYLNIIQGTKNY